MANRVTYVTQNERHVLEDPDTFVMNLVNSDNSWNMGLAEDVRSDSLDTSDLPGGQQTQQDGMSTETRLDDCGVSSGERNLSCSNHGLPIKEQGSRSTRSRRHNTLIGDRPTHRRRSVNDMTKPLKSWLYDHKDNPYPTKNDKQTLSESSEMTLIQVSNWFANARRRLKNTVGQSGLTWKNRIKLYNKQARGNADQVSLASSWSGETEADFTAEGEMPALSPLNTDTSSSPSNNQSQAFTAPSTVIRVDPEFFPRSPASSQLEVITTESAHLHKFKQNILHRYLHDSVQHQRFQYGALQSGTRTPSTVRVFNNRDSIGSTGDFEDVSSTSPNSTGSDGNQSIFQDGRSPYDIDFQGMSVCQMSQSEEATMEGNDTYRKELVAAMVLTNMARAKRHLLPLGMMT
ncbi:homeobox protein Mohawk-like [Asterias amurensis]|uniref:homeobox protein Mohawk-like n=1 Tax=Asterias amurensis TaxID=7602 RepID=UPI003AB68A56